jgi:adenine-specific DNA-methyltransferase
VTERNGIFADVLQETILATYRRGGMERSGKVGFTLDAKNTATLCEAGRFALSVQPDAPWLLPRAPTRSRLHGGYGPRRTG